MTLSLHQVNHPIPVKEELLKQLRSWKIYSSLYMSAFKLKFKSAIYNYMVLSIDYNVCKGFRTDVI